MNVDIKNVLQEVVPFRLLPLDAITELADRVVIKFFQAGAYIFRQGQMSANTLFLVVKGSAEVLVAGDKGNEIVVGYRSVYDFFGETVLLVEQKYPASVRAREELGCLLVPGEQIELLIARYPGFSGYFTHMLLDRMRLLYEEIINEQSDETYGTAEVPLFRKRVGEIMSTPAITCFSGDSLISVTGIMVRNKISAVVVVDEKNRPVGLITHSDLVEKIIHRNIYPYAQYTAEMVMDNNIITINPNALFNQALVAVAKHRVKHLAVISGETLVGIVTLADLVRTRSTGALLVMQDIESQQTIEGLVRAGVEIDNLLGALVAEKASVPEIMDTITEFHDSLTRKIIQICEQEMLNRGYGAPPVDYCWLNMGSPGRREQTLRTDQDNAIVYADCPPGQAAIISDYFLKLAGLVVDGLQQCGFAKCSGNVMASNPLWCMSISQWRQNIGFWVKHAAAEPENIRKLTIFLDNRPVFGNSLLAAFLWDYVLQIFREYDTLTGLLAYDDSLSRVPVNVWGGFVTEKSGPHKDELNLKNGACIHIQNCIRIFAVRNGITSTSTLERLKDLRRLRVFSSDDADFIQAAFETLMMFRIRENFKKVKQGQKADNYINPGQLSKRERLILKDAFAAVARLQKITGNKYNIAGLSYLVQ